MNLLNFYLLCVLICCAWYGHSILFAHFADLLYGVVLLLQALDWRLFHGGTEIEHW